VRYPAGQAGSEKEFRDYRDGVRPGVREFYRQNHRHQTLDFVLARKREYLPPRRRILTLACFRAP